MSDLFKEFDAVSAKAWKQKIQVDLKGKDYNSLLTKTPEGIDIKPFYHPDEDEKNFSAGAAEDWKVTSKIVLQNKQKTAAKIRKAFEKGIENLWLVVETREAKISDLLEEVEFEDHALLIDFQYFTPQPEQVEKLSKIISRKKMKASLSFDPIGKLAQSGNWFHGENEDFKNLTTVQNKLNTPLFISGEVFQNAGANAVQQVAYSLAQAVDYLNFAEKENSLSPEKLNFQFKMAIGGDYFMEIAKLRALRLLFGQIARTFGAPEELKILAFPTRRNKTLYDYNVNLLRTTTESMSAILGGADEICNAPYDEIYHEPNEFGERISRNQLLILKHESYFNAVRNPAEGTYYIENLTEQIGKKALEIIKSIEKTGGFLAELKEGTIQRKVKESADEEQGRFNYGEKVLVGTNTFENPDDRMKDELEKNPFLERNKRKTILPPLVSKRLAEVKEQKRLEEEAKD